MMLGVMLVLLISRCSKPLQATMPGSMQKPLENDHIMYVYIRWMTTRIMYIGTLVQPPCRWANSTTENICWEHAGSICDEYCFFPSNWSSSSKVLTRE